MTTCPLCGSPDHPGKPCYAELRTEWKRREAEKRLAELPEWPDVYAEFCEAEFREAMQEGV